MSKEIYALGVGHNTPVLLDLAIGCGYTIIGLYHYNNERTGEVDHGFEILGSFDDLWQSGSLKGKQFLLTMGDLDVRETLAEKILSLGGELPSLIHPSAVVSTFAKISNVGVCIFPFVFVQSDSVIGDNTVILSHVNISHNSTISKNCFIAGSAVVGAYTEVEEHVFIGQGALTISGKSNIIGHHSYLGAGALITKPVEPYTVVAGFPAKVIKELEH